LEKKGKYTSISSKNLKHINRPEVECVYAADVISFAKEWGFFNGKDEDFSFRDAYCPIDFENVRYADARVWSFFRHHYSHEEMGKYLPYINGDFDQCDHLPLWIKPDKPLSLRDLQNDMRDHFEGTPLEDATVMTLGNSDACDTRYDAATGTLHLEFLPANKIEAGLPYIVKWKSGDDISDPVFNGVTIRNENPSDQSVSSKDGAVTFVGSYSPFVIDETNIGNILYIGSANKIGHSANARTLRSCRAHFELTNPSAAPVRTVVVDYGEEEIVTGIISMEDGRSQMEDDSWYTMSGIRLNGEPTEKGIYLFNGKKVVIK
jgi:hypothetical protein